MSLLTWPASLSIAEGMEYQLFQILAVVEQPENSVNFVTQFQEHPGVRKNLVQFCMTCPSQPDDIDSLCPACRVAYFEWGWNLKEIMDSLAILQHWQTIVAFGDRIFGTRSWQLIEINVKIFWLRERQEWIEDRVVNYLNEIAVIEFLKYDCNKSKDNQNHKCGWECDMEVIVKDVGEMRVISGEELGARRMELAMTGWRAGRRSMALPKY